MLLPEVELSMLTGKLLACSVHIVILLRALPVVEVPKPNGHVEVVSHIPGRGLSPGLQPLAEGTARAVAEAALTAGHAACLIMHQPATPR